MNTALITTTINVPRLLDDYCRDAREHGHEDISVYVIGDKKTPPETAGFCAELASRHGYDVRYLDVDQQLDYLKEFSALRDHLPFNSIQRRNIGLLMAYRDGAEKIITIDDDNFLAEEDFIGKHSVVGTRREVTLVTSSTGWYNVCEMLIEKQGLPFYHRGYPHGQRWQQAEVTQKTEASTIVVNAGLWLEAPDIDALTWLDLPIEATGFRDTYPEGVALAANTWSPFNSQNTALAREVIPAYFLSPHIGRYDDIWASYVVKKIADHLDGRIHFGHPLVRQKRNPHNYFKDFDKERLGMELTDAFVAVLANARLTGSDYATCFGELTIVLREKSPEIVGDSQKLFGKDYENMLDGMQIWHEVFSSLAKE